MATTPEKLSKSMEDLYWKSAHREVCNMMLFFLEAQSNEDIYEAQSELPGCSNFEKMFKVWTGGQGGPKGEFNTESLFQNTVERAKRHYEVDKTRLLARQLLQSSSFLDIDILYEPAIRSIQRQRWCSPVNAVASFQRKIGNEDRSFKAKYHRSKSHRYLASAFKHQRGIAQISRSTSALIDLANSKAAPSGLFHLSMMFGPLIFESGVPSTKHGVMISSRPHPRLFRTNITTVPLVDGSDDVNAGESMRDCLVLYEDTFSSERCVLQKTLSPSDRHVLCSVKRVYGAAFSGYPPSTSGSDNSVLDAFITETRKCKFRPSKTTASRRRQLHQSAEIMTGLMRVMFGDEVRKYLNRIALLLLDSHAKLSWHIFGNNCQRLIDRLLNGKDFEYTFPRLPKGFGSIQLSDLWKIVPWPRYLISFGDRVEGKDISVEQPNSSITKFCQKTFFGGDIIDLLELEIPQVGREGGNYIFKDLQELTLVTPQPTSEEYRQLSNNALWDLPRDSLSILQYHLIRPPSKYSATSGNTFDEKQWIHGRLRALYQIDIIASYTGALGSALLDLFYRNPNFISEIIIPKSRVYGSLRSDEQVRIVRSGEMVGYVISQRQEHLTKVLDSAEPIFDVLQKASQRYFGKASVVAFNSKDFKAGLIIWLRLYAKIKDNIAKDNIAMLVAGPSKSAHLVDRLWPLARMNGYFGLNILDDFFTLNLQAIQVANRDNWVYLQLGSVLFAYQIMRKTKSTRKDVPKGKAQTFLSTK